MKERNSLSLLQKGEGVVFYIQRKQIQYIRVLRGGRGRGKRLIPFYTLVSMRPSPGSSNPTEKTAAATWGNKTKKKLLEFRFSKDTCLISVFLSLRALPPPHPKSRGFTRKSKHDSCAPRWMDWRW